MKTKWFMTTTLVLAVPWGIGTWHGGQTAGPGARAAQVSTKTSTENLFLFGESIPKKLKPGEQPSFGINVSHIDWWLGDPSGKKLKRLEDPKTGRVPVRPVDRTVILKRDPKGLTLLGPDGGNLFLSLKDGPLAKAQIDSGLPETTTFAFTPDGKEVVFANAKGSICRIGIKSKDLTVTSITGVNRGEGVQFSPDGSWIAYAKYFRANDFVPGVHQVYVARADFTGEKKLTEYTDRQELGFGFLPDGRVGVVGPASIRAIDPKTAKTETVAGPWKSRLQFRAFGGFNPDGSTFIFDLGGPYMLRLFAFDVKTQKLTIVRREYLESFQQMVWVRVAKVTK